MKAVNTHVDWAMVKMQLYLFHQMDIKQIVRVKVAETSGI